MITVILVEPKNAGNVGAVARAMANFELKDLLIINPRCRYKSDEAKKRAMHAKNILENAKTADFSVLKNFDYVIGTTSKTGTDYNILRSPMTPEEFAGKISKKSKAAIMFGKESDGLTNKELELCDFAMTIPASEKYNSLNLSHAAAIIFYELYKEKGKNSIAESFPMASVKEKAVIMENFYKVLDALEFSTKEKKQTQKAVWKKLFSKAMLTKREAFAVIGLLKKLKK